MQLEFGGQRIVVAAGEILIGSDLSATVRLVGDGVFPRHARVRRTEGGAVVIEPGTGGGTVRVNGVSIGADPAPLLHGDHIGIGAHELVVVDPARAGATQMVARAGAKVAESGAAPLPLSSGPGDVAGTEPAGRLVSLNDGREYQVTVVPFVLGRDATAEIVIGSPDASRRHAEIVSRPDGDVVVDLSANGTFVNGARISGRHQLKALDVIRIGAEEFRYYPPQRSAGPPPAAGAQFRLSDTLVGLPRAPIPTPRPAPASRPLATMLVKSGSLKGQRFAVKSPVINIGRADYNDVQLPDPSISSTHVKLQLREGVWSLTDLGSTNGTTVDGEKAEDDMPLSPGALLKLGDVSLSFEPHDEAPARLDRTALLTKPEPTPPPSPLPEVEATPKPIPARAPRPAIRPIAPEPAPNRWIMIPAIIVLIGLLAALVFLV
jgi:pSer/pThr/pTyr-binding forkhead associated (FHA) protein